MAEGLKYEFSKNEGSREVGVPDMYDGKDSVEVFGSGVTSAAQEKDDIEEIKRRKIFLNRKLNSAAVKAIGYLDTKVA